MDAKTAKTRKRRKRRKQENRENGENAKTAKTRKRENGENGQKCSCFLVFNFSFSGFLGFLGFLVFSFSGFLVPLAAPFWPGRVFYVLSVQPLLQKLKKKTIALSFGNPISHNNSQGTLMKVSRDHKMTVRSTEPQKGHFFSFNF